MLMLCEDEDDFDLFEDTQEKLLSDEDILMLLLEDCSNRKDPIHRQYHRFDIGTLSEQEFLTHFRFQKQDMGQLMHALRLKKVYTGTNGIKWSGIEGLCILLRRLCYPNRLADLVPLFGRHRTELSHIINQMCTEIFELHKHRLNTICHPWLNYEQMAEAVHAKGACLTNCWGFLDGSQMRICRPGDGQEAVYNGHKRQHSFKFQSLIVPSGIIVHFWGPFEGRRHDSALYFFSGLDQEISQVCDRHGNQMCIYGDSAYAARQYLLTPFKGSNLSQLETDFNGNMAKVRTCVEWGFGKICGNFAFLDFHKNLKARLQAVGKYYLVGAILTNAHTCLYGSQTGRYFLLEPPTLDQYFH